MVRSLSRCPHAASRLRLLPTSSAHRNATAMMRPLLFACALLCGDQSPAPALQPAGLWFSHNEGLGEMPLLCRKTSGEGCVWAARMLRWQNSAPRGRRGKEQERDSDGRWVGMPQRLRGGVGIYDDVKGYGVKLDLPPRPEREPLSPLEATQGQIDGFFSQLL
jgi:hypothetical protein